MLFSLAFSGEEFAECLDAINNGELDVEPLVTGVVPIEGVPEAFALLADPEAHAKLVIEPEVRP